MNIETFEDLLLSARQQADAQRLLFVFARSELPDDCTAEQRQRYEAGMGGALVPLMEVDKMPEELSAFSQLVEESDAVCPGSRCPGTGPLFLSLLWQGRARFLPPAPMRTFRSGAWWTPSGWAPLRPFITLIGRGNWSSSCDALRLPQLLENVTFWLLMITGEN